MKNFSSYWFTTTECKVELMGVTFASPIGIVLGFDDTTKKFMAYIGNGLGRDQAEDEGRILSGGGKLPHAVAVAFFPDYSYRPDQIDLTSPRYELSDITNYKTN